MSAETIKTLKNSEKLRGEVAHDILTKNRSETPIAKETRDLIKETDFLVERMNGVSGKAVGKALFNKTLALYQTVREFMRDEKSAEKRKAVNDAVDDVQGLLLLVPDYVDEASRLARMGRSLNRITSRGKDRGGKNNANSADGS